jgi:hypothetical protein
MREIYLQRFDHWQLRPGEVGFSGVAASSFARSPFWKSPVSLQINRWGAMGTRFERAITKVLTSSQSFRRIDP